MPQFSLELRSINLHNLPETEQAAVLDRFASFLNSLTDPVTIDVIEDKREVQAIGATYSIPYKRYFLTSPGPLENLISVLATKFTDTTSLPEIKISTVGPRYVIDQDSHYVQVYNVTRLGGRNAAGFLSGIYPIVHAVRVELVPIGLNKAKKLARTHALSIGSRLIIRRNEGRSVDPEEQLEYERANTASQMIASG